jgi:hypothetical protein
MRERMLSVIEGMIDSVGWTVLYKHKNKGILEGNEHTIMINSSFTSKLYCLFANSRTPQELASRKRI